MSDAIDPPESTRMREIERARRSLDAPACAAWLREHGATSPMSPCGVVHLVLGKFQQTEGKETGTYPVSYYKPMFGGRRGGEETWYHYHEKLEEAPTRQQCLDWVSEQNSQGDSSAVSD